ncbi:hypothetical protein FHW69_002503 [Luteibacter sp. Sphag1AF]|uniref:DUF2884 family protein n=1 Tax=Luteibacter sp. Sphag1AF TaxID=2587031 RepID=UPI0016141521|nr:DUF2884 family protein [Luteibacter sp. Sphag1AF]MBB3227871.1 hypothetical protein [Luteibacter sp. Sphag1AF]
MKPRRVLAVALALAAFHASAEDLSAVCHVASTYDVTINNANVVFDRGVNAPRQVIMRDGSLTTDGARVTLRPDEEDRVALFERQLRDLLPRVRALASDGIGLAAQAVRREAATAAPDAVASGELDRVLNARVAEIRQRIAVSHSSRDWQEAAMREYANQIVSDIAPILTQDVGNQAMNLAMTGDLNGAAALRDRVGSLTSGQDRIVAQLESQLRPRVQALCPSVRQLAELQSGIRDSRGQPLQLIETDTGQ